MNRRRWLCVYEMINEERTRGPFLVQCEIGKEGGRRSGRKIHFSN